MTTMLRLPEVMRRVGLSRSCIYAMVQRQEFPAPIKLTAQASAWEEESVETWLQNKIMQSKNG